MKTYSVFTWNPVRGDFESPQRTTRNIRRLAYWTAGGGIMVIRDGIELYLCKDGDSELWEADTPLVIAGREFSRTRFLEED
jgi:hypothetical protein